MNKLGKIAPLIVIVTCLGSLFFVFKLSGQKKDLKQENTTLASARQTAERERDTARNDLQTAKTAMAKMTEDLNTANANLQAAQVALAQKTQEADGLKTQLADKGKELDQTKTDLASAQETLKKIQEMTGSADFKDFDQMRDRLTAQADENKILGKQLVLMREQSKMLQARITELTSTPINLRGRIVAVENHWGFVVLDVGRAQHVGVDSQFLVYRDSKMIGKVQVQSVGDNVSVAQMLPDYQRGTPKVGDLVVH